MRQLYCYDAGPIEAERSLSGAAAGPARTRTRTRTKEETIVDRYSKVMSLIGVVL